MRRAPKSLINTREGVAPERDSPSIPSVLIEVSAPKRVLKSEAKPQVIARVLARLSVLEFSAKDYVEDYLRHLHRRNYKFTTLSSRLGALQLFLSFIADYGKRHIEEITREDLKAFALRNVIFRNPCEIAKAVPAYILRLSLSGGLCDQIEEVIRKDPVAVSNI